MLTVDFDDLYKGYKEEFLGFCKERGNALWVLKHEVSKKSLILRALSMNSKVLRI
jgi:hypothetical protein